MKKKKLVKKVKQLEMWLSDVHDKLHELTNCYADHMGDYHATDETTKANAEEEK